MKNKIQNIYFIICSLLVVLSACSGSTNNVRAVLNFNADWKFELRDSSAFKSNDFNDSGWRTLDLPHDWSIEGKFDENNPAGFNGGALPGGVGWYRKAFVLTDSDSIKRIYVTFDGIYKNSEVYVNGVFLGKRPNGYISFQYDLTQHLFFGGKENVISVRVDNSDQPNERWYSGSGIYRNVWLLKIHPIHINLWGTHITTPIVSDESAVVQIAITVRNTLSHAENIEIETHILNHNSKTIAKASSQIGVNTNENTELTQKFDVAKPVLWCIENPYLYRAITYVKLNKKIIDVYETSFGIRNFSFDARKGFSLNGKSIKIKGVCNHHDLGALGAAVNKRAIERQLQILKAMGCNGIRTTHNPPAPELLHLCDSMGFIVMAETFDVWRKKKVEHDYSQYFEEWHVRDLTDHLLRDRNHPSIFSWSIGNEILEQWDSVGAEIAIELAAIVKKYMPDVPVTAGCNNHDSTNSFFSSGALDLIGFNYGHKTFETFPDNFPNKIFIGSETTSSLNSRGCYDMPSDSIRRWPYRWDVKFTDGNYDNTCSAYDNCAAPWGSTHAETWKIVKKNAFLAGMYIWTGFDYLGEPTPYQWPSRSSYFGIVDLAGFPKDVYYMYQSEWTDKPVLHIFPHWNWTDGKIVDVWAYTNFDEVELFLNGVSQGKKSKSEDDLHLSWRVKFEKGELKAVGKKSNGELKEVIVKTAGKPAKLLLEPDRQRIAANGVDLSFVTVSVLDADGNIVPDADNLINFVVSDSLSIAGVDNGCQTSHEPFKADYRRAFNGKCLLIVQSKYFKGKVPIKAFAEGIEPKTIFLYTE
ncbi:MAG: DUF4982 domain-containing protein [Prolixibacteraceae bacterium]|nr:DUF4982 domain-containing protein [Prolixibacteraceae bacterium]